MSSAVTAGYNLYSVQSAYLDAWSLSATNASINLTIADAVIAGSDDIHLSWTNFSSATSAGNGSVGVDLDLSVCAQLERYKRFRLVMDVFVMGALILAGLTGNTLAVLVIRADNMNNTVSYLLQALAMADNAYLAACIFMQTLKALCECTDWVPSLAATYPYLEPYVWPCASIAQTTTVWLVVLVTLDRYIAICRPFDTTALCTTQRARRAVGVVVVLAVLYNIPRFFEHQTQLVQEYCHNTTRLITVHSALRQDPIYFIVYKTSLYFVFRVVVPIGTLTVLNTRLIFALRGATRSHAALTRTAPPHNADAFTRILVVVVSVFIICELPSFIVRTIVTVRSFTGIRINVWYYATLANVMLTVNSSVNCLIYCISGRRFRKVLRRLVVRGCCHGRGQQQQQQHELLSHFNGTMTTMSQMRRSLKSKTSPDNNSKRSRETTELT